MKRLENELDGARAGAAGGHHPLDALTSVTPLGGDGSVRQKKLLGSVRQKKLHGATEEQERLEQLELKLKQAELKSAEFQTKFQKAQADLTIAQVME